MKPSKPHFLILAILLFVSFFVRVYRTHELLRFYYDQGRDAIVVTDMVKNLKPVLVGPTTGLAGILRGPAFYYLLLPAYLLGKGSPVIAAIWLQVINTFGLYIFYLLARKLFSPTAGLIAILFLGLSAHMVDLSRWLSNPSPILTTVPLMLYGLLQIKEKNKAHLWWPIVALMLGLNLQLEMASEIWFIPATLLLVSISKVFRPKPKTALISVAIFVATLLPQIIFDLRHDGIMRQGVIQNFSESSSPSFGFDLKLITQRLEFYVDVYSYIISPNSKLFLFFLISLFIPLLFFKKARKRFYLPLLFFLTPLLILTFYQGNSGNFYSYYLMGTFPIFLLLVSGLVDFYSSAKTLSIFAVFIVFVFTMTNFPTLKNFLKSGIDGPNSITIQNQLDNIDWIYKQADGKPFNVDIYVPPVIPYSYDYLFSWYGKNTYGYLPSTQNQTLEFTLYEVDPEGIRFADWYQVNISDHPVLRGTYSSGGVHSEFRTQE